MMVNAAGICKYTWRGINPSKNNIAQRPRCDMMMSARCPSPLHGRRLMPQNNAKDKEVLPGIEPGLPEDTEDNQNPE
jgi:hypothetical protein